MTRDDLFKIQVDELIYRLQSVKQKSQLIPSDKLEALQNGLDWTTAMVKVIQEEEGIPNLEGIIRVNMQSVKRSRLSFRSIFASWKQFKTRSN